MTAVIETHATTVGVDTIVGAVASAGLTVRLAVQKRVGSRVAAGETALAGESACVHVGDATVALHLDGHLVTAHKDLTADIDGSPGTSGELAPGVVNLTKLREGSLVVGQGSETAGNAVGKRDSDLVSGLGERVGNLRLSDVDERRGIVADGLGPKDDSDRASGVVGEGKCVRSVIANPDIAVA